MRKKLLQEATKNATLVPFKVMETAVKGFALIREMIEKGNPNSITDAAVGALALRSCIKGAYLNVRINISSLDDKAFSEDLISNGLKIEKHAIKEEEEILLLVDSLMKKDS